MEAKINIIEMSPRLPYLKSDINDYFSLSFLYNNNIFKIDNIQNYINKEEMLNIPISNISENKLHFYLIKNGGYIIGMGEIPLITGVKWFNLNVFNNINFDNNNEDKNKGPLSLSRNNQEIINTYNIKFKFSVEIKNNNIENNNKINILQKSISLKGSADSNSNSISNTCTNSKTPKNISMNLLTNNNNPYFKKIEIYSKKKAGNTLFSSINNRFMRNQTEKKLKYCEGEKEVIFSFNDYYDRISNNNNTEVEGSSLTNKKNILNLTNLKKKDGINLYNKRKKILSNIDQVNIDMSNSTKILEFVLPKNDYLKKIRNKNKSNKNVKTKIYEINKNLFLNQNGREKEKTKIDEKKINNNSFKKIEDVIIDQNFKNEIKNDELIGVTSNNSSIISSFNSTKNNYFYKTNNSDSSNIFEKNNLILDVFNKNEETLLIDFNNKKKELFNIYKTEHIRAIKDNKTFLEFDSFINKIINLQNEYQKIYKEFYYNFNNYKKIIDLFQSLLLYTTKKKNKLDYIKTFLLLKQNKNQLIQTGLKSFNNTRKCIIHNNEIPFWKNLICSNINPFSNVNQNNNNNQKKIELIQIFLRICAGKTKYFNSLSKKCYNDIKIKFLKESNTKIVKSFDKKYYSPGKSKRLSFNKSTLQITTKNNFYSTENSMKTPKNTIIPKKSCNFKKEGITIEKSKISSFNTKKTSKKKKTSENKRYQKK